MSYKLMSRQKPDLIEWLVVDVVGTILHLPLALKGGQVEEPICWGWCRSSASMVGKSFLPSPLFKFSLEGADHQEEVKPERPTGGTDHDVHKGWAASDAEQDVEDAEEERYPHHDNPGHHEADLPLKYNKWKRMTELGLLVCTWDAFCIAKSSKPTVLVPWTRQAEKTMVTIEAMRKITP